MRAGRIFTHPAVARQRFRELVDCADAAIQLSEASLVIAQEGDPGVDVRAYLAQLDRWSDQIREKLNGSHDVERIVAEINHLLFEQEGFHGGSDEYNDPRNALLNEVLDRHEGLPLALSIVYLDLSRRLGIDSSGVSLPGRFLVKIAGLFGEVLIDPFDSGRVLSTVECQLLMDQLYGGGVRLREHHLRSVGNRQILMRLLAQLKSAYLSQRELERTVSVIDRLLILDDSDPEELRHRGTLAMQLHRYDEAIDYLERYLEHASTEEEARHVKKEIYYLRAWLQQN